MGRYLRTLSERETPTSRGVLCAGTQLLQHY
jgi:hypothetical protein